jgi:hypothetical protein
MSFTRSSPRAAGVGLGRAVDGDQAVEHALHAVGERLVGEIRVGEQRIAALGRHLAGNQHGAHRRLLEIGGVGVPHTAEVALLVLELDDWNDLR